MQSLEVIDPPKVFSSVSVSFSPSICILQAVELKETKITIQWPWNIPKPVTLHIFSMLGDFKERAAVKRTCQSFNACMKESKSLPLSIVISSPHFKFRSELENKQVQSIKYSGQTPAYPSTIPWYAIDTDSLKAVVPERFVRMIRSVKVKSLTFKNVTARSSLAALESMSFPSSVENLELRTSDFDMSMGEAPRFDPLTKFTSLTSVHIHDLDSVGQFPCIHGVLFVSRVV